MPEHDKERLPDSVAPRRESDEAIVQNIRDLLREIKGMPSNDVIVEGESLPPKIAVNRETSSVGLNSEIRLPRIVHLSHDDSAAANNIWQKREKKKAA